MENGHQYNLQHLVFVTKYRYKMFKNVKTIKIILRFICNVTAKNNILIKEFSFGDDYSNIPLEVNILPILSIAQIAQFLKGYS